jgi:hypothetical protein
MLEDRRQLFKRLVWGMLTLMAVFAASMVWVLSEPDTYQEHLAAQPPAATTPDGSVETPAPQPGG